MGPGVSEAAAQLFYVAQKTDTTHMNEYSCVPTKLYSEKQLEIWTWLQDWIWLPGCNFLASVVEENGFVRIILIFVPNVLDAPSPFAER